MLLEGKDSKSSLCLEIVGIKMHEEESITIYITVYLDIQEDLHALY